mmetsp:Transcript_30825/g.106585  ORF Transcript_30825/g.106585 Transcript_30825/m.106585 type:complete len:95 (+) Transcript_30825:1522-1806(+)
MNTGDPGLDAKRTLETHTGTILTVNHNTVHSSAASADPDGAVPQRGGGCRKRAGAKTTATGGPRHRSAGLRAAAAPTAFWSGDARLAFLSARTM